MSKTIKPFADAGGFTTFRNEILDHVMPLCKPNTWKVVCCVLRATKGWQKEEDELSFSQIMRRTGIKSRPTANSSIQDALKNNLILRRPTDQSFMYKLNTSLEITLVQETNSKSKSGVKTKPGGSVETKHTIDIGPKETENNKEIKDSVLLRAFLLFFGLFDKDKLIDDPIRDLTTDILKQWKFLFPDKPQPRRSTVTPKIKTRSKDPGFLEKWRDAMVKASHSKTCRDESWFSLIFFLSVKDGENNWEKCLRSWISWKDDQNGNGRAPHPPQPKLPEAERQSYLEAKAKIDARTAKHG